MGATNRSATAYVAELTPGITPANPAFKAMRVTSNGLNFEPQRTTSNEIRPDRQITDAPLMELRAGGDIGIELSYAAFDDMFEAAFQGTWAAKPKIIVATEDTEISDLSATTATVSAGGAAFKTGHIVRLTGFPTAGNNKVARVSSSTGTTVVFPAATFAAESDPIPVGAKLQVVGFQGASADLAAVTAGGNGLTSAVLDFTTLGLSNGEWLLLGGSATGDKFATAANNGWVRVSGITQNRLSFDVVPAGWSADVGTGKTLQVFAGDFLTNGVTQRSFTMERQQQDLASPSFEYHRGSQVNSMELTLRAATIITGQFGYLGLDAIVDTARIAGATDIPAPAFPVLNAASNVGRIAEGGAVIAGPSYITELGFNLNNNLERQLAVGVLGAVGIRNGEVNVSGSINAYFGDIALLQKVLNDTETSLFFRAGRQDGDRESILIDIPRVKLSGNAPVTGKNADRMFNGQYQAMRHPTLGITVSAGRFPYLPF